jgi:hypothetical protein
MLGKCSELGGGSTLIHPFPGSWFPKFSELGGGEGGRPSLPGILAPRSYVRKMAGKCLELVGAPFPTPPGVVVLLKMLGLEWPLY